MMIVKIDSRSVNHVFEKVDVVHLDAAVIPRDRTSVLSIRRDRVPNFDTDCVGLSTFEHLVSV